jgi:hypothetical protein
MGNSSLAQRLAPRFEAALAPLSPQKRAKAADSRSDPRKVAVLSREEPDFASSLCKGQLTFAEASPEDAKRPLAMAAAVREPASIADMVRVNAGTPKEAAPLAGLRRLEKKSLIYRQHSIP